MENRISVISIIVEQLENTSVINSLLHEYGQYIVGRMGIPYREKKISVVSVAVDAPQDIIATLSGKIGRLSGISVKTAYSGVITNENC